MSLVFDRIGDTVVSCSLGKLSRDEVIALSKELESQSTHTYVAGAAGDVALDAASRNFLFDLLRRRGIRVVAVSDSKIVRGIVTAAMWMGVTTEAKSWDDVASLDEKPIEMLLRQRRAMS